MIVVPVITSDKAQYAAIAKLLLPYSGSCEISQLTSNSEAEEFLHIEMPELAIINFADATIDAIQLLNAVKNDSWLLSTGIIGLCDSPAKLRESGATKGTNVIALLEIARISRQLPQVFSIISNNRHMLFQRVIGNDFGSEISEHFELKNDALEASVFTNLICNYLFNLNRIDAELREQLNFVLIELLINAIEHGNCGISYEEKTSWLEKNNDIYTLIDKKCTDPEIARRKVFLQYQLKSTHSVFKITDEGAGFDWRSVKEPTASEGMISLHGRGITLSRGMTKNLVYNETGNEVQFEYLHQTEGNQITPALFQDLETVNFKAGDIVFCEGDPSNYLYYISRGSFEVLINNNRVSVLTPDDIFLGEMSFLLNNRRSATVKAIADGCLVRVSKKEFVEGIKEKPHYALFLSRLLARRIERTNKQGLERKA